MVKIIKTITCLLIAVLNWCRSSSGFVPTSNHRFSSSPSLPTSCTSLKYYDLAIEDQKEELKNRLSQVKRDDLSKLQVEFRALLETMLFTPQEMSSVVNPRMRAIYEGIAASYYVPEVYRAFEVLYEDYTPLRIAGRIIHKRLRETMEESKKYQKQQIQDVVANLDFPMEAIMELWTSFINLAGEEEMPIEKVRVILLNAKDKDILFSPDVGIDSMLELADNSHLSFEEFMRMITFLKPDIKTSDIKEILSCEIDEIPVHSKLTRKRTKYGDRYDEMLVQFSEWKEFIPSGEGRRLDILRGCFVGYENPKVVEALRIIYTDYPALRMSGDWIFQVVSTLMKVTMTRKGRTEKSSH